MDPKWLIFPHFWTSTASREPKLGLDARTRLKDTGDSVSQIDSQQLSEAVRQLSGTLDRCTDSLWERFCTVGLSYELPSSVRRFIGLTMERFRRPRWLKPRGLSNSSSFRSEIVCLSCLCIATSYSYKILVLSPRSKFGGAKRSSRTGQEDEN